MVCSVDYFSQYMESIFLRGPCCVFLQELEGFFLNLPFSLVGNEAAVPFAIFADRVKMFCRAIAS